MRPEFELGNKYFFFVTSFSFQLFGKNIVRNIEKGTFAKCEITPVVLFPFKIVSPNIFWFQQSLEEESA